MSGFSYADDIAALAEDIERWAGLDARIIGAVKQLMKLYEAEVNALAFEAIELQRLRDADKAVNWELTPAREAVIERSIMGVSRDPEADTRLRDDMVAISEAERRPWGSWGRQAGSMDDGDWRTTGIA